MYELIFYSIPGFLFVASIIFWYQFPVNDLGAVLATISTPLIGYIFHNMYRFLFELSGNYSRKTRKVIDYLIVRYSNSLNQLTRKQAFLIWEHSIYHKDTSVPFLEHDGRMWRFIQSFWSVTMVSILLIGYLFWDVVAHAKNLLERQIWMIIGLILISLIFYARGKIILSSLNDQEIAFAKTYETELFNRVKKSLYPEAKKKRGKKHK